MRFIATLALFATTSAIACPNLAGKYANCRSQTGNTSGSTDMVITQAVQNKITTYSITSTDADSGERSTDTLKADGKTVGTSTTDPDSGMTMEMSNTVTCDSTKSLNINMIFKMNGDVMTNLMTNISKAGNILTMKMTGSSMGESISEILICE